MTRVERVASRAGAHLLGGLIALTGLLPPRLRYGYVHPLAALVLRRPVRTLPVGGARPVRGDRAAPLPRETVRGDVTCVLLTGTIEFGGIGAVVEMLATELPSRGVTPVVLCVDDGARAARLRAAGIDVFAVADEPGASSALQRIRHDVLQLHGAPEFMIAAARSSDAPRVAVLHNTEIHFSRRRWRRFAHMLESSSAAVAVSDSVRAFHAARVPAHLRGRILVIPNAAPAEPAATTEQRRAARESLERTLGVSLADDTVFVCLARYDPQKNIAGTVASFLRGVRAGGRERLVIAGEPTDWAEYRRADAIRRSSVHADRVHLLAASDGPTLLAAADAFLLNSFFEGWAVAATEAWAAGLPLVLSDVGGARELVARDPERSVLIRNPCCESVTDARVERARWRATQQRNARELGAAVRRVALAVQAARGARAAPGASEDGLAAMADAHAAVLRAAAAHDAIDSEGTRRAPRGSSDRPILWFPGVGWDTLPGTDRHLALELAQQRRIVWVDTPHSVLRARDRVVPPVTHPHPNIVRLRASTIAGVQRPVLRGLANRRRARAARRYLAANGLRPSAVVASTTAPMLDLVRDLPGQRVYYATDDFVEAAAIWGVSRRYLRAARERNLRSAHLVLAVSKELGRHLQRGSTRSGWLPNGAQLSRFDGIEHVSPAAAGLARPIAGVIGQFNARTDLDCLFAARARGLSLLLVGPRSFTSKEDDEAFDRLIADPGVRWTGEVPADELVHYLRAMDVGLTPYRDTVFNRRSYPLKTVEYLAAGLPVVATDVAAPEGLDRRWVHTAGTPESFAVLAEQVARAPRDSAEIRRSAAAHSWHARAAKLQAWLDTTPARA